MTNKIVVVGVSASGKSTFARALAQKTSLPLTRMDAIMWCPGWEYTGDEYTNQKLYELSKQDRWVIEGYITTDARTFLFDEADQIIYLDYNRFTCAWQYVKRWWQHKTHPREELPGSPDTLSLKFLWLVFTKGEAKTLDKYLTQADQSKITRLKTPKAAKGFLQSY